MNFLCQYFNTFEAFEGQRGTSWIVLFVLYCVLKILLHGQLCNKLSSLLCIFECPENKMFVQNVLYCFRHAKGWFLITELLCVKWAHWQLIRWFTWVRLSCTNSVFRIHCRTNFPREKLQTWELDSFTILDSLLKFDFVWIF